MWEVGHRERKKEAKSGGEKAWVTKHEMNEVVLVANEGVREGEKKGAKKDAKGDATELYLRAYVVLHPRGADEIIFPWHEYH